MYSIQPDEKAAIVAVTPTTAADDLFYTIMCIEAKQIAIL